jgi:hypothetical protein
MAHITLACKQITLPAFLTMLVPPFPFTTYFVALIFILTSKRTLETILKECLRNPCKHAMQLMVMLLLKHFLHRAHERPLEATCKWRS